MGKIYGENLWGKFMGRINGENLWGKLMGKINGEHLGSLHKLRLHLAGLAFRGG